MTFVWRGLFYLSLWSALGDFLIAVTNQVTMEERVTLFHSSVQPILVVLEAPSHIVATLWKLRETKAWALLAFSCLLSLGSQAAGWSHSRLGGSPYLGYPNLGTSLWTCPQVRLLGDLDPVTFYEFDSQCDLYSSPEPRFVTWAWRPSMLLVLLLLIHSNIGLREVLGTTLLLLSCHNTQIHCSCPLL